MSRHPRSHDAVQRDAPNRLGFVAGELALRIVNLSLTTDGKIKIERSTCELYCGLLQHLARGPVIGRPLGRIRRLSRAWKIHVEEPLALPRIHHRKM